MLKGLVIFGFISGIAVAQETANRVVIKKLAVQIQQTPIIQAAGIRDKTVDPRYWMEIEAELEVETVPKDGFIPELRTNWYAIFKDKKSGKPVNVTGEVVYRDVRTKSGKAYVIAFISPDTLEKLTGKEEPNERDVESVALVVSGNGIINTGKHAEGLQKATEKEESKWWTSDKYEKMPGLIMAKSKTPFSLLWTDRYPVENSESAAKP